MVAWLRSMPVRSTVKVNAVGPASPSGCDRVSGESETSGAGAASSFSMVAVATPSTMAPLTGDSVR